MLNKTKNLGYILKPSFTENFYEISTVSASFDMEIMDMSGYLRNYLGPNKHGLVTYIQVIVYIGNTLSWLNGG